MPPPRLLIVEDEIIVAMDLEQELLDLGYQVAGIAASGEEAVAMALETRPDLVLMDIRLGGDMDGIDAARQIHHQLDVPVIYLTAYADQETIQRARLTGPFGYLAKPFQERDLHTTIEMALYKHQTEKKLRAYAQALETRNRELDLFVSAIANNLSSLARLIHTDALSLMEIFGLTEASAHHLNNLVRNSFRLEQIISGLLLLTHIQEGKVHLHRLNMARIVAQAQQRLERVLVESETRIKFPSHWPDVLGYAPWVEEVWVNIMLCGVEYGGQPPRLQIGATIEGDEQVRFWLRDNGPGLSAEEMAYLFAAKQDAAPYPHLDDLKLRLGIVRFILDKLGGQFHLSSAGKPGDGILYSFVLQAADREAY